MTLRTRLSLVIALGGCFFVLDQLLKFFARTHQEYTYYIIKPYLGWEFLANPGVAFSIPIPTPLLILLTPIILIIIFIAYRETFKPSIWQLLGTAGITVGALSNLVDRILFGVTIDYVRIVTLVINLADVLIVAGALVLIFCAKQEDKPLFEDNK